MKVRDYVQETPEKMKEILKKAEDLFKDVKKDDFDKIILTGSGTSYHAALQSKEFLQQMLNIEVEVAYPFMITDDLFKNQEHKTLVMGISQGGSSYSTFNAMKIAKQNGCRIASMAGMENALIDDLADYILPIYCGPEKAGAKTKGFTTTKLNLMLFALYVGRERHLVSQDQLEEEKKKIESALEKFDDIFKDSDNWVTFNKKAFAEATDIKVIATGDLYGDVLESALKMLETLRVPVTGYEFDEFIHGIYNAVNADTTILIFDSGQEDRTSRMIEVLSGWTDHIFVISNQQKYDQGKGVQLKIDSNNLYEKLFFIVPAQLLCSDAPPLKGIDPAVPKDPKFHEKLSSKKV